MRESNCKESELLSAFIDGRLDGEHIREVACHLKDCPSCEAAIIELQKLRSWLHSTDTPSTPPNREFWANAYREARLNVLDIKTKDSFGWWKELTGRRAASLCAVIGLGLIVLVPFFSTRASAPRFSISGVSAPSCVVDIAPLLRAHTSYAALQPLSDCPRISMILSDEAAAKEDLPADDQANVTSP